MQLRRKADELLEAAEPREALLAWLRALVGYTMTVRGLAGTLLACQDDESSPLQRPCQLIADTTAALVARAQAAGAVRPDVQDEDVGRLAYGIAVTAESSPEDRGLADRLLAIALDGLTPRRARATRRRP
jgi:hypothetical protein